MIKFLLCLCIIAFTTFIGYLLTKKYRKRRAFFTQFNDFNNRFLNEIAYFKRPVTEFIARYSYQGEFNDFLQIYIENIDDPFGVEKKLQTDGFSFLKKEEKDIIFDYFLTLGKGNTATQTTYYNGAKEWLINKKKQVDAENKRYGDLFIKLGFLFGLLVLILIV